MKALVAFIILSVSSQLHADSRFSMTQAVSLKMNRINFLAAEANPLPVKAMAAAKAIGERNAEEIILFGQENNLSLDEIREAIIAEIQRIEDGIDQAGKGDKAGEIMAQSEILGHLELLDFVETQLEGAEFLRDGSTANKDEK